MLKNENYIQISGWMINILKLSGNELMTFALIYGFSQDEESEFTGSINYVKAWLNCSRPTAMKALSGLVEKKLVIKKSDIKNKVIFNKYSINLRVVKNLYMGSKESLFEGSKESLPNNTNNNNTNYNNGDEQKNSSLFPEFDKDKKSLFKNSTVGNYITFSQQFKELKNVDLKYYFASIMDWNEIKQVKRTAKGWIATARNFMKNDNTKGKLKILNKDNGLKKEQMDFLNL